MPAGFCWGAARGGLGADGGVNRAVQAQVGTTVMSTAGIGACEE